MSTSRPAGDATRTRLLEATRVTLAQFGPRKLSLTDIAAQAGVSRPTLYRYFASKDQLLAELAVYERERFQSELRQALQGVPPADRLDRALRVVVEFQRDHPAQSLVAVEPLFMLEQLALALRTMTAPLLPLFAEQQAASPPGSGATAEDVADLVVRVALSHFLIRGDDDQLLHQLRHVVGLHG